MHKNTNNPIFLNLLIFCISLALLLGQTNRMHFHLGDDAHSDTSGHVADVHAALILHDHDLSHSDPLLNDNHHPVAIDVSPDNLIQKTKLLNPLVLILFFVGLLLVLPRLLYRVRKRPDKSRFISRYYLFQPPLRAPPLI